MLNEQFLNRIWLAVMLAMLIATAPNWLARAHVSSGYDAPWVYPGLNPNVQ